MKAFFYFGSATLMSSLFSFLYINILR